MKECNSKFGQFISEQRIKNSMQGQELAKRLGISLGYLSQLEHGKRLCPDLELLRKMINVFDLNTEETNALYDLYAEASGQLSPDIAEYIQSSNTVKKALRCAREASATDKHWERFIESLKK